MRIGKVVAPGPDVKLAITRSSIDSEKARSQAAATAGAISGKVTVKNTVTGRAPRSAAASSRSRGKPTRRERTTTVAKHMQKVVCAAVTVQKPRSTSTATNSSSSDRPRTTSGITRGIAIMPANRVRPRNGPWRASASAAMVPSTVASVADTIPIRSDRTAASISACWARSPSYQRVENPPQTVTSRLALNENTTRMRIGRYRNDRPSASTAASIRPVARVVIAAPPCGRGAPWATPARSQQHRDGGGERPVAVRKELRPDRAADHDRLGPAEEIGHDESPTAGMNIRRQPATIPGAASGSVTSRNRRSPPAPRSAAASSSVGSSRSSAA